MSKKVSKKENEKKELMFHLLLSSENLALLENIRSIRVTDEIKILVNQNSMGPKKGLKGIEGGLAFSIRMYIPENSAEDFVVKLIKELLEQKKEILELKDILTERLLEEK